MMSTSQVPVVAFRRGLAVITGCLALTACGGGQVDTGGTNTSSATPPAPTSAPAKVTGAGADLYATHCGMCHGPTGRGDGPMAQHLNPKPRGFVNEPWRFFTAQTPDEEQTAVEKVIREGILSSGMPAYGPQLTDLQIREIATFVLELRRTAASGS